MYAAHAPFFRERRKEPGKMNLGRAERIGHDLNVQQRSSAQSRAKRLQDGLLAGPACCIRGRTPCTASIAVRALFLRENARPEDVTEESLAESLYTAGQPDPDLLIRTSGEQRLSNYLLYQCAYSELYFTPVPWPDFGADQLREALAVYAGRSRRFGKTQEQIDVR